MIWVDVRTHEDAIVSIEVTGHAEYAEYGHDVVCGAVSSIMIGGLNAIDILEKDSCTLIDEDNRVYVEVLQDSGKLQTILNTICIQLETIAAGFDKYLGIRKTEV